MKFFSTFLLIPAFFLLSVVLTIFAVPIGAQDASWRSIESTSNSSKDSNNQDYIFYLTGHHGHVWSKLSRDSTGLHVSNGTSRSRDNQDAFQPYDTIKLIEDNIKTISWGLDSLWRQADQLRPSDKTMYNPIYTRLYLVRHNDTLFTSGDAEKFIGKDSDVFNPKLQKLMFLMLWLASPSIREYIPTPADSLNNEK